MSYYQNQDFVTFNLQDAIDQDDSDKVTFRLSSEIIKIDLYKLYKYSQLFKDGPTGNQTIKHLSENLDQIAQQYKIKEDSIKIFLKLIQEDKADISCNHYCDLYKLSDIFKVNPLKKLLNNFAIQNSQNIDFIINLIIDQQSLENHELFQLDDISSNMEDVLCNNIDKCLLNQNFGILQSPTIYRIIEKSDKDKINSDILYDFIMKSIKDRFLLLYFLDIKKLSYERLTNFCIFYSSESKRYFDYLKIDINYVKSLIDEKRRLENIVDNLNREKEEAVNKLNREKEEIIKNLNREKEKLNEKCQKLKEEIDQSQLCDDCQILQMLLNRKDQQISKLGFLLLFLLKEKIQSKISINSCEYIFIPTNETVDLQNIINMPKIENIGLKSNIIEVLFLNSTLNSADFLNLLNSMNSVTFQLRRSSPNINDILSILVDLKHNSSLNNTKILIEVLIDEGRIEKYYEEIDLIKIEPTFTLIENNFFNGYLSLTKIIITSSVTCIGDNAFENCSKLVDIIIDDQYNSKITSIGERAFSGCSLMTKFIIPQSVTFIGNSCFLNCSSLTEITIPQSVTYIGSGCFSNCSSLKIIEMQSQINKIEDNVFNGCKSLNSFIIPSSVVSIEKSAFSGCSSLTEITIPQSVTYIGSGCFSNCSSLNSITIQSKVTKLDEFVFDECSSLKDILIPSSVTSIENYAFKGCISLKYLFIPSSITFIGCNAFQGCKSLRLISIPKSISISSVQIDSSVKVAVNENDCDTLCKFGSILLKGEDVEIDKEEATKYLKMAIDKGNEMAKNLLNSVLLKGKSSNNIEFFKEKPSRDDALFMARVFDEVGIHQDYRVNIMKIVIEYDPVLSYEEMHVFSVAYKNIVLPRLNSIRTINGIIESEQSQNRMDHVKKLSQCKETIFSELEKYCFELIDIVDTKLLPVAKDPKSRVFYYKLEADFYKYICESKSESRIVNKCKTLYEDAYEIAKNEIPPNRPVFLELICNYSAFLYEIIGMKQNAIELAQRTFNDALIILDDLSDDSYGEATLFLQHLRDNVSSWTQNHEE